MSNNTMSRRRPALLKSGDMVRGHESKRRSSCPSLTSGALRTLPTIPIKRQPRCIPAGQPVNSCDTEAGYSVE